MRTFIKEETGRIAALRDTEACFREWYDHYLTLNPEQQAVADYLLTAAGKDSYADDYMGLQLCPVSCVDQKNVNNGYGVLYAIRRACFPEDDMKFCFLRSDLPARRADPAPPRAAAALRNEIRRFSSGLAAVRLETLSHRFADTDASLFYAVTFRLDPAAVRETVEMYGARWDTREIGEYILALTDITGEFSYCLGVLDRGRLVPLWENSVYFK